MIELKEFGYIDVVRVIKTAELVGNTIRVGWAVQVARKSSFGIILDTNWKTVKSFPEQKDALTLAGEIKGALDSVPD